MNLVGLLLMPSLLPHIDQHSLDIRKWRGTCERNSEDCLCLLKMHNYRLPVTLDGLKHPARIAEPGVRLADLNLTMVCLAHGLCVSRANAAWRQPLLGRIQAHPWQIKLRDFSASASLALCCKCWTGVFSILGPRHGFMPEKSSARQHHGSQELGVAEEHVYHVGLPPEAFDLQACKPAIADSTWMLLGCMEKRLSRRPGTMLQFMNYVFPFSHRQRLTPCTVLYGSMEIRS